MVLSVDIASHSLRSSGQSLMGQRVADMLAGVSILAARPEVDASRLGTVGLSLGKHEIEAATTAPNITVVSCIAVSTKSSTSS